MTDTTDWEIRFDNGFVKNNGENIEDSFRDPNGDVGPVKQFIGAELFKERMKAEREKIAQARADERQKVLAEVEGWLVDLPEKINGVTQEDNITINKDRAELRAKLQEMKEGKC